jgi:hypothetical protein
MILRQQLARTLAETGLPIHQCQASPRQRRRGGVCLLTVSATAPDEPSGIVVAWTQDDALAWDLGRYDLYRHVQDEMNALLARLCARFGFATEPFGRGGATLVTSHPTAPHEAGEEVRSS